MDSTPEGFLENKHRVVLDQLHPDHHAVITKIAADLDMEPVEALGWAVALLDRYVAAGGAP